MPLKELGDYSFNPEIGPSQARFDFNGNHTLEVTQPKPAITSQLYDTGIFPTPECLPLPSSAEDLAASGKFVRIIQGMAELNCIGSGGRYINHRDHQGAIGAVETQLVNEMRQLVSPTKTDEKGNTIPIEVTPFIQGLRENQFIISMISTRLPKGTAVI